MFVPEPRALVDLFATSRFNTICVTTEISCTYCCCTDSNCIGWQTIGGDSSKSDNYSCKPHSMNLFSDDCEQCGARAYEVYVLSSVLSQHPGGFNNDHHVLALETCRQYMIPFLSCGHRWWNQRRIPLAVALLSDYEFNGFGVCDDLSADSSIIPHCKVYAAHECVRIFYL